MKTYMLFRVLGVKTLSDKERKESGEARRKSFVDFRKKLSVNWTCLEKPSYCQKERSKKKVKSRMRTASINHQRRWIL